MYRIIVSLNDFESYLKPEVYPTREDAGAEVEYLRATRPGWLSFSVLDEHDIIEYEARRGRVWFDRGPRVARYLPY